MILADALKEGLDNSPLIGALIVVVAAGQFVSLDRIVRTNQKFKKQRRIIFHLDSKAGQVGSTLLLELLKLENGENFSKPKFVQKIDKMYFQSLKVSISSGEINEALSRIFRKTMPDFFKVDGRKFVRAPFYLSLKELSISNPNTKVSYESFKHKIDDESYSIIKKLNSLPIM